MNAISFHFLAQAAPSAPNPLMSMAPLILIFGVFYFLMIRPQQKRQKELKKMVSALQSGDEVVTSAGIHGTITNVKGTTVIVRVADNVKIEFDRSSIVMVKKEPVETIAKA